MMLYRIKVLQLEEAASRHRQIRNRSRYRRRRAHRLLKRNLHRHRSLKYPIRTNWQQGTEEEERLEVAALQVTVATAL